jgi:hypothetical protein
MLVDFVDQLLVDLGQLRVELVNLLVEADEGLLVGEFVVKVGDRVEIRLLELFAHAVNNNIIQIQRFRAF